jgi:sugar phosphate isomerase/epimerase
MHVSRRVAVGTLLAGGLAAFGGQRASLSAAENAKRPHFFKLSLAAYSLRDALAGKSPTMTLDDFVRLCADLQLDGCELTSYYFPKGFGPGYLSHLKQLTHRLGLDISGTAIAQDFCQGDIEKRARDIAHTITWIDHAAAMGAPCIRIFAGNVPKGVTEDEAIQNCIRGIEACLPYAAEKGVILALENHGGITGTSEAMLKIVKGVAPSPYFGVNFDGGNFRTADPYADLEKIAPYAVNAQLKVDMHPDGKTVPADFARVIGILKAASYRGYVVLEYEGKEPAATAVPKHLAELRTLIRA